jgi:hypothetical protein
MTQSALTEGNWEYLRRIGCGSAPKGNSSLLVGFVCVCVCDGGGGGRRNPTQ